MVYPKIFKRDIFGVRLAHLLILLAISLIEITINFGRLYDDSYGYIDVCYFFQGKIDINPNILHFWVRPLIPFLASFIEPLVGVISAFSIINSFMWLLSPIIFYNFSKLILEDDTLAFFSTLFLTCSAPFVMFGSTVHTEMGGYFFLSLSMYLICKFEKSQKLKDWFIIASCIGTGILAREIVACALAFQFFIEVIGGKNFKKIAIICVVSLIPALLWFNASNLSYIAEWVHIYGRFGQRPYGVKNFLSSLAAAFSISIIFTIFGFLAEDNVENLQLYYSYLLSSIPVLLAWPSYFPRYQFILFPCFLPLAARGLEWFAIKISKKPHFSLLGTKTYKVLILILYILFTNYNAIFGVRLF